MFDIIIIFIMFYPNVKIWINVEKNIKAFAGTSVGSLNAVLFLKGDYERAERVWLNMSPERILTVDLGKIAT